MPRSEPTRVRRKQSAHVLAERFGVHPVTIRRTVALERATFEAEARQRQDAIRAYKAAHPDLSMRAIAAHFECSVGTVHRALKAQQDAA